MPINYNNDSVNKEITGQNIENINYQPKILIADDDLNNIKLMVEILAKKNYQFLKANDGQQVLDTAIKYTPDLIILDIMMPIYNGLEVTRILKRMPATQSIPIIIVTAYCELETRKQALDAGADEFLSSPVNAAELLVRVSAMLRLKIYQEQANIRKKIELNFANEETVQLDFHYHNDNNKFTSILLVEDSIKDAKLIQAIFCNSQYTFTLAETGEHAINLVQQKKFDLVILDIILPDMSGFEVCQRIRFLNTYKHIPMIFVTSISDNECKIKCLEFDADDFFVKPVNPRELKAKVQSLLKKKAYLHKLHYQYENAIQSAIKDGLTGLYKRTYFIQSLDQEIKRSLRYANYLSIMMIDIDNFKIFNDTLGHLGGDAILCEVGKSILENIREIDLPARYGGEEFIILFPHIKKESALIIAKRIQSTLQDLLLPPKLSGILGKLTVSIGIADFPDGAQSAIELINNADQMLYHAKRTGKNKACLYVNQTKEDNPVDYREKYI